MGLNVMDVKFVSRYGGNIRVYLGSGPSSSINVDETKFGEQFKALADQMEEWRISTKAMIEKYVSEQGKLRAKAFPGRAAILIKLLGIDSDLISAVYEIKGSIKTGHYVPGTRIPIFPEADLYKMDMTQPILNLAWHIPKEVRENLKKNGYTGKVIDICDTLAVSPDSE